MAGSHGESVFTFVRNFKLPSKVAVLFVVSLVMNEREPVAHITCGSDLHVSTSF